MKSWWSNLVFGLFGFVLFVGCAEDRRIRFCDPDRCRPEDGGLGAGAAGAGGGQAAAGAGGSGGAGPGGSGGNGGAIAQGGSGGGAGAPVQSALDAGPDASDGGLDAGIP